MSEELCVGRCDKLLSKGIICDECIEKHTRLLKEVINK